MNATHRPHLVEADIQDTGDHQIVVPACANTKTLVVNPLAGEILTLCDGTRTVEQIALVIAEKHRAPFDRVAEDTAVLLAEVDRQGLLRAATPPAPPQDPSAVTGTG